MTDEAKIILEEMHDAANNAGDCVILLQSAFIYNSSTPLKECYDLTGAIKTEEPLLTKKITALAKDNPALKVYVSVPVHLLKIADNIEKTAGCIDKKIKDGILFSDRAVTEATFILQRLAEILRPTSDIILARNVFLNKYVQESEANLSRNATEYATMHEERLVRGECLPVASSIYVNMLDAIKNIAWHAKELCSKLVESPAPKE